EDGIRYFHVTGVQTCALPISLGPQPRHAGTLLLLHGGVDLEQVDLRLLRTLAVAVHAHDHPRSRLDLVLLPPCRRRDLALEPTRSEERRVGQELTVK